MTVESCSKAFASYQRIKWYFLEGDLVILVGDELFERPSAVQCCLITEVTRRCFANIVYLAGLRLGIIHTCKCTDNDGST